jgi:hypothetical protein
MIALDKSVAELRQAAAHLREHASAQKQASLRAAWMQMAEAYEAIAQLRERRVRSCGALSTMLDPGTPCLGQA